MAKKQELVDDDMFFLDDDVCLSIGDTVPSVEFEIFHGNKIKKVNLSDFRKKWLIVFFYPADFTFICPTELEEMADHYNQFKKLGAEILSVSTDTAFVHKAWHDNSPSIKKITFPMAADPTGKLCRLFGTYIEEEGLAFRGTFIVDPKGEIVSLEINNNNIGRSATELIRKLQAAIYVEKNGGQVCPASWKPGDKTLKPGMDLIGKI